MYLDFNKQSVHLQVVCGILEEYKVTDEIKEIQKEVTELKDKLKAFNHSEEVSEIYKQSTELQEQLKKLFEEKIGDSLSQIQNKVDTINEKYRESEEPETEDKK